MYQPAAHAEDRVPVLHDLVRRAALAHLVTLGEGGLAADPVPLLLDAERGPLGTLLGHVARANPLWRQAREGAEALAIFAGPDAYVSPTLYPSKAETGEVVPTWDYVVVHAHGPLIVHDDPAWAEALVRRLTETHEAGSPRPWSVDDAPESYVAAMVSAIVGIELPISRLEGKRKLSQNRPAADLAAVRAAFSSGSPRERAVAGAIDDALGPVPPGLAR